MPRKLTDNLTRRIRAIQVSTRQTGYTAPGVYVQETPLIPPTLQGANLSAAAFVGLADQGPLDTPVALDSFAAFTTSFGAHTPGHLAEAARAFFANGGRRLYVLRLAQMPQDTVTIQTALSALDDLDDLGLLALPGISGTVTLQAAADYSERRRQLLLVADCPAGAWVEQVRGQAAALRSSHIALYCPWLRVAPQGAAVPPSGALAGLLARQELSGRLWKAPAGVDSALADVTALETEYSDQDLQALVPENINPLRKLSGRFLVWGARTLSANPEFRYVNVRRFFCFVEASVRRGIPWTGFEASEPATWQAVHAGIRDFLHDQWRAGALQGTKPEEGFFVRCDSSTMTQADMANGELVIVIGLAMLKPAEFTILQIRQSTRAAA